jgi:NADPH:quinone reductase-like Zn-dependent oxidoreductase
MKFKLGDPVCAISQHGAFAEEVLVHEDTVWSVPGMSRPFCVILGFRLAGSRAFTGLACPVADGSLLTAQMVLSWRQHVVFQ